MSGMRRNPRPFSGNALNGAWHEPCNDTTRAEGYRWPDHHVILRQLLCNFANVCALIWVSICDMKIGIAILICNAILDIYHVAVP